MTPCDQTQDGRDALTRAIAARGCSLDDALDVDRHCTLELRHAYRLRRDLTTRLHGQNLTLAAGTHVRVGHALNDLATLREPDPEHGELLAVTLTRETDPHGWADVFGPPVWTIDPRTRRLVWPDGTPLEPADWTFTRADWDAQHWPACPRCGAVVDVGHITVPTRRRGHDALMVGGWSCPAGCSPRRT